jgi:hypothetical protein
MNTKTTKTTTDAMNTDDIFIVKGREYSYVQSPYCSAKTRKMFTNFGNIQLPNYLGSMSPIEQLSNFGQLFLNRLYRHILELHAVTMSQGLFISEKEIVQNLISHENEQFEEGTNHISYFQTLCNVYRNVRLTSLKFYTEVCLCPWDDLSDLIEPTFGECEELLYKYMKCCSSIYGIATILRLEEEFKQAQE